MINNKRCTKCSECKPQTSEHFPKGTDKDGFSCWCKACHKSYYQRNREKKLQYSISYYAENKEQILAAQHERYISNENVRSRQKELSSKHYTKHKNDYIKRARAWARKNPEQKRNYTNKRRAYIRTLPSGLTKSDWARIIVHFDHKCAYCGGENKPLQQDHFIPVASGGGLIIGNIVPACADCNSSKHNKDAFKWYADQSFFDAEKWKKINDYTQQTRKIGTA